jgi:hypothetical protein
MLNQVPGRRDPYEVDGEIHYASRRSTLVDHEIDLDEHDDPIPHEIIDLGERRKSSISSSKSGSGSSAEVNKQNSTVAAGK